MTETEEKKQESAGQDKETVASTDAKASGEENAEQPVVEEELPSVDSILSASRKNEEEEESVQDICNRYLNIFRQLHVLSDSSVARYNEEVKDAPEDVVFDLYNLPGGLELIDHITFLRTGEKVNSRRLRARQKQEEEMGFAPKKKEKEKEPEPQPVVPQQPVIQYVPMPTPSVGGDGSGGGEAMASMQAMMAQFVSMQQTAHAAPSFSASELATALLNGQKELMAQQTKNYLEGQKALLSAQTKAFIDGQKTLIEMQREISKSAEETLLSAQDKLLSEAREAIDKQQKILFAMQKSMLDEMSAKINEVVGKVAENAKPTVDYGILSEMQEKFSVAQSDAIAAVGKENIAAMEKVADSIKALQIVNNITQSANTASNPVTTAQNTTVDDEKVLSPAKGTNRKIETIQASQQSKDGDISHMTDDDFIRMGREKRRERFKKHHQSNIGSEDTFAVSSDKTLPKNSVFVNSSTVVNDAKTVTEEKAVVPEEQETSLPNVDVSVKEDNVSENDDAAPVAAISDVVGGDNGPVIEDETNITAKKNSNDTPFVISDSVGEDKVDDVAAPSDIIQPVTGQNEPPLSDDNEVEASSPSPSPSANIYNRPKVEDIRPDSEPFIPAQGSLANLPAPGVMSEQQENRTEKNIGFAINEGIYKQSGGTPAQGRTELEDPFSKKISPKSISRFKSKKTAGHHEKDDKKGIFSVFKKLVKDDESSDTDV